MNPIFWCLIDVATNQPVQLPQRRENFRREHSWTVRGGRPPTAPGKAGYVWVQDEDDREREFYPSVYGLRWSLRPELHAAARLMIQRGGGFACRLAEAYLVADQDNAWRLLEAFDDLFARYLDEVLREPA